MKKFLSLVLALVMTMSLVTVSAGAKDFSDDDSITYQAVSYTHLDVYKRQIFNHEEARTGLWNFVSAHFSMIDRVEGSTYTDEPLAFLLEDASIKAVSYTHLA